MIHINHRRPDGVVILSRLIHKLDCPVLQSAVLMILPRRCGQFLVNLNTNGALRPEPTCSEHRPAQPAADIKKRIVRVDRNTAKDSNSSLAAIRDTLTHDDFESGITYLDDDVQYFDTDDSLLAGAEEMREYSGLAIADPSMAAAQPDSAVVGYRHPR